MRPAGRSPVAVAAGALVVAAVAAWLGTRLRVVVLDEAVYKFAAAQYVDRFPQELIDDRISRGIARFYALVLAPLSWVFDGDVAVRLGRALNGVLWAATAAPVYLLARRVVRSGALAAVAAVLAVAVPWLTLATILFSEALAYFLFALFLLCAMRALERAGLLADALVAGLLLVLVLTRVQFVVLVPAWLAVVAWAEWPARRDPRGIARRRPVLTACVALTLLGALAVVASGNVDRVLTELGGPYERLRDRDTLQGDFGLAALFEVEMLAIGVGIVPAILAAAWVPRAIRGRFGADARRLAVLGIVTLGAVVAGTLFAQGGWLDARSEERYFIYAVPSLWVFAVAAFEQRLVTAGLLVRGGLVFALIVALVPVPVGTSGEQIFLGPVSRIVVHVGPQLQDVAEAVTGLERVVGTRDAVALLVLAVVLLTAVLARRGRGTRAAVLAPAIVLQLVLCGYAVWAIERGLGDSPKLTGGEDFAKLGWVDRAVGEPVTLVQMDAAGERELVFWNDRVLDALRAPGVTPGDLLYPVNVLPARDAIVRPDLTLELPPARGLVVGRESSPYFQLAGPVLTTSHDGRYELRRVEQPARAVWSTRGLDSDEQIVRDVGLLAPAGHRFGLRLVPPAPFVPGAVDVTLGDQTQSYAAREQARELRFDTCDATGPVRGTLRPTETGGVSGNRQSGARLERVEVTRC